MKKSLIVLALLMVAAFVFGNTGKFSITTDFAFYPKSDAVVTDSGKTHFAPLTGFYSGLEARVVGKYSYVIPTPFGDNPLVKGNNLNLACAMEVTPVSVAPTLSLSFTPIAFLNFTASAKVGTGWEFIGIQGMGTFDSNETGFVSSKAFSHFFYEYKFSSLFQFDLAAVMPGDWNHVVTLATYDVIYSGLTGVREKPYIWQASGDKFTGLSYYSNIIVGYQMPLVLQTVGVQFEFQGNYSQLEYDAAFADWNPTFMKVSINPICILKFNEKHALTIQFGFSSRRGYSSAQLENEKTQFSLHNNSREWYFNRVALSYAVNL